MTKIANVTAFKPVKTSLTMMIGLSLLIGGQSGMMAATAKASAKSTTKVVKTSSKSRKIASKSRSLRAKSRTKVVAAKAPAATEAKKTTYPCSCRFQIGKWTESRFLRRSFRAGSSGGNSL